MRERDKKARREGEREKRDENVRRMRESLKAKIMDQFI